MSYLRLIFAQREKVDMIWASLASLSFTLLFLYLIFSSRGCIASLTSGPLSSTSAFEAKVATCPKSESANSQHILCLYMPNVYDKDAVTEVCNFYFVYHFFR